MSKTLATIGLNGARFNAAVGWHPEERLLKNNFLVDISVSFEVETAFTDESLTDSVDYMQLHEICLQVFSEEAKLLESVAQQIIDKIIEQFAGLQEVSVTIKKLNPPIKAQIESSFVKLVFKK